MHPSSERLFLRLRLPGSFLRRSIALLTSDSSGSRSCARPAGFQEAAVPSSETATKAFAMPAARAPEPARLRDTPWACASAAKASVSSSAAGRADEGVRGMA